MLETFREHSKGWLAKLILALITIPFALWGVDSYLKDAGSNVAVAEVGGQTITAQEYANELQDLRNRMQAEAQGKADPALLDSPAVKQSVLDKLIATRLLNAEVRKQKFSVPDEVLAKVIVTLPEFQKDGQFSQEQYDSILSMNRLTPTQFEARMRNDLLLQQVREGLAASGMLSHAQADRLAQIELQQREVSVADISAAPYMAQVSVDAAEVKNYYEKHKDKFRVPEQVRIEYLMLAANNLITSMTVTDEEAKKFYTENASKFQGDEQRRASHILISFGDKADAAAKKNALDKALSVLTEAKRNPEKFAELAQKYSQDPGSAANGGDLGAFGRGMMVKSFDDAVFSMAPGAISEPVESEFGYHIIKLTEIMGQSVTFDAAKANIRAELMYQKALAKFAEQADSFSNIVYEQSESLQPAAQAFGLQAQTSGWMSRADAMKFFKSDKLVAAIFSNEVLKDKRNSEAIEAAPNTLVAARVVEYRPSAARDFKEVSASLEDYLKREKAVAMALKKGAETLAALRQGKSADELEWIPPVTIDRKNAQGLNDAVMQQAFKINVDSLPAYAGVENQGAGYTLIRVSGVESVTPDEDQKGHLREDMQAALAMEYMAAYLGSLKAGADITVKQQLLGTDAAQ